MNHKEVAQQRAERLAMARDGVPVAEIARAFGRTLGHVYCELRRAGIKPSRKPMPKVWVPANERTKKVRDALMEGPKTSREIADAIGGISPYVVTKILTSARERGVVAHEIITKPDAHGRGRHTVAVWRLA